MGHPAYRSIRLGAALTALLILAIGVLGQSPTPTPDAADEIVTQATEDFNAGKYDQAIDLYKKALPLFLRSKRETNAAYCIFNIAAAQQNLTAYKESIATYKKAVPLLQKVGDKNLEALALKNIGDSYLQLDDRRSSNEYLLRAVPLLKALDRTADEAAAAMNVGHNFFVLGELKKAAEYYDRSLDLYLKLHDPQNQALALANLGLIHAQLDEQSVAVDFIGLALKLIADINDPPLEAQILQILGNAYLRSGDSTAALESYRQALAKFQELGDRPNQSAALAGVGASLSELGRYDEALKAHQDSLVIAVETNNLTGQFLELGDIALAYMELGKYDLSFEYNQKALDMARRAKNRAGEESIVNNIGIAYLRLGSLDKAAEYIERAAAIGRELKDERSIALLTMNLGAVYTRLKQYDKAIAYFERSLPTLFKFNEFKFIAIGHYYYGTIRRDRGELDKAIALHNKSIDVAQHAHTPKFEARARVELGLDLLAQKNAERALTEFSTALIIAREVGARDEELAVLDGLMRAYDLAGKPDVAIFYGKQSVNLLQATRGEITKVDKGLQLNYVKDNEQTYRHLADTLVAQGRLPEAQQVLAMLKEEELSGFVRRDAKEIENLSKRSDLRANERTALEKYNELAGRVTLLGAELSKLEEQKRHLATGEPFAEQARFDQLTAQIKDANAAFRIFLDKELAAELGAEKKKEVEADRALQGKLRQWGEGTVALSTIVGEDRYRVILTTPNVQVDGKTEIKAAELNRKVSAFRRALLNERIDPRPLGKELYDILIKPIEKDLEAAGAKTIVWSLDGTLRYIPMSALWDGSQYLVQKYQNVIVTSTTRQSLQASIDKDWNVLGGGVTKASQVTEPNTAEKLSFDELKGVGRELSSIIVDPASPGTSGMAGVRLLDAAFSEEALKQNLTQTVGDKRKYNVVHFATHFRLGSDTSNSFLLLGSNQVLSLAEIADTPQIDLTDVELVTLSACNTGFGAVEATGELGEKNGKEIDSLAQFIEMRGAKAVMASLWPVVDESTGRLMADFYRLKKDDPTLAKAEALRRAQLALLSGEIKADPNAKPGKGKRSEPIALDDEAASMPKFTPDPAKPFAHPHYWAPFVLIGNWR